MNHARAPIASTESVRRSASILSAVALAFAASASLVTILWDGAFPAPNGHVGANTVLAEGRGWSVVTFAFAVPLGALAIVHARRGSMRARLAWIGSLGYLAYTYLELAVSPPFTALYLLYVVAFASALTALVMGAASIDVESFATFFARGRPRRAAAAFALLSAALLAAAWLKIIVGRTLAGSFGWPTGDDAVGHVVHALDLGLWVPLGIATGVLLLRKRPLGHLFAAVFLVMATCMLAALTAMVAWHAVAAGESILQAAPFAAVSSVALALALAYLRTPG